MFFLLPQRWGPVIQTMWAVLLSKCLHRRPTHSQRPAQGQHSTTVMWIDVHQQHPPTHTFITTYRETTCVSFTPESTQPTQAILPTLTIKEPLARPETDGKADKILDGMQYHTGAELRQGKRGKAAGRYWILQKLSSEKKLAICEHKFLFRAQSAECYSVNLRGSGNYRSLRLLWVKSFCA